MTRARSGIRLGTRGSALAQRQTEIVARLLVELDPSLRVDTVIVGTAADSAPQTPISHFGDKGVFVRTLERALLEERVDLAVHSLKDVPSDLDVPGLDLVAFTPRADPRDVLVSRTGTPLRLLHQGARVGTSSIRRRVQLAAMRGDLDLRDIRGNVDTRLAKVHTGEYDAIVLAAAGLERLGLSGRITEVFSVEEMVPDAGQGIIAVQARTGDVFGALAGEIDDGASRVAAVAERAIVRALNAGCRSPVGAHCLVDGARIRLIAMAAHDDGSDFRRAETTGAAADAEPLGGALGARLLGEIEA